jgi:homogentisate 1,2-dioxygenase
MEISPQLQRPFFCWKWEKKHVKLFEEKKKKNSINQYILNNTVLSVEVDDFVNPLRFLLNNGNIITSNGLSVN